MVTLAEFGDQVMKTFVMVSFHFYQKLIDEEDTLIELCYLGTWNYIL